MSAGRDGKSSDAVLYICLNEKRHSMVKHKLEIGPDIKLGFSTLPQQTLPLGYNRGGQTGLQLFCVVPEFLYVCYGLGLTAPKNQNRTC